MTNTELTATVLSMNYGNIGMYAIHSRKTMVITLCIYPVLFHSFIYCEIPSQTPELHFFTFLMLSDVYFLFFFIYFCFIPWSTQTGHMSVSFLPHVNIIIITCIIVQLSKCQTYSINLTSGWIFFFTAPAIQFSKPHNKSIVSSSHNLKNTIHYYTMTLLGRCENGPDRNIYPFVNCSAAYVKLQQSDADVRIRCVCG